ncbi:MAG: hypothetical protein HZA60_05930 [Deltaproteobacteria bacterium]|nr:hypothetical protein [Deltaproteobacteria bacterium]
MTVIVVSVGPVRGPVAECGCCGLKYPVKRTMLWLSDGKTLYGEICPDCILRGPRGAAMLLVSRLRERETWIPGALPVGLRADIEAWRRRMARKAAAGELRERR